MRMRRHTPAAGNGVAIEASAPAAGAVSSAIVEATPEADATWIGKEIRNLRKVRGLGLQELSNRIGKSIGYLSEIERGLSHPSISTLQSISQALGVQIGWFFPQGQAADPTDRGVVVRSGMRRRLSFGSGVTDYLLSPDLSGSIEFLLSEFEPGASNGDSPYTHAGEEVGLVLSGVLELWVDDQHFLLSPGDSFSFRSTKPHRYRNPGDSVTRVVWAVSPPSY